MIDFNNMLPRFPGIPGGLLSSFADYLLTNIRYACILSSGLSISGISDDLADEWGIDPETAKGCHITDFINTENTESLDKLRDLAGRRRGRVTFKVNYGSEKEMTMEAEAVATVDAFCIIAFVRNPPDVEKHYGIKPEFPEIGRIAYTKQFDKAADGITLSTEDGNILTANHVFLRMLKYPITPYTEIHAVKDNIYVNPEDRENILKTVREEGFVSGYEMDMRAQDGSIISVICSVNAFTEQGKTYYESTFKDITEHRKLEKELIRQNEILEEQVRKRTAVLERQRDKLMSMNRQCKATSAELRSILSKTRTLFNAITDPVVAMDSDFNVLLMNRTRNLKGKKCYEVLFDKDEICVKCPAVKAMKTGKPASIEVQKGERFYQMQCYPVLDTSGKVDGVIEWAKDITAEKDFSHQMLQADRLASLGQLVSGIGHEINNPNTFILGNMKIIREALDDMLPIIDEYYKKHPDLKIARLKYPFFKDQIKLLADDMESGAERIRTIVYDLRKFGAKSEYKFDDDVGVNALVERSIRLIANQVKRKANITTNLAQNLPLIRANGIALEQVFVNVIMNASESMGDEEKGNISISTSLAPEKDNVVISISDDGSGMDPEIMRHIFDPFFSTKRNKGGTGLGLSIAYRIIKEHEGEIDVESIPGTGTVFTITIPALTDNTDGGRA